MPMRIDKAGQNGAPFQVQHFDLFGGSFFDRGERAKSGDFAVAQQYGLNKLGLIASHGEYRPAR